MITKIFSLLIIMGSLAALGKGMDELKPTPKKEPAKEGSEPEELKPKEKTPPPAEKKAAEKEEPKPEEINEIAPSPLSQALAGKLMLTWGVAYASILKAHEGDWYASGMSDLRAAWRWNDERFLGALIWTSLRYAPIAYQSKVLGASYRGVIEGYHLGSEFSWSLGPSYNLASVVEVGYLLVYVDQVEPVDVVNEAEENAFAFTGGVQLDWIITEKIYFGPSFQITGGNFQIAQYSINSRFIF